MATVRLLGWSCNAAADAGPVDRPTGVTGGTWEVYIVAGPMLDANIDVVVSGLRLKLRGRIPLAKTGSVFTPSGGSPTTFQMWRTGETPSGNKHRILIGPLVTTTSAFAWDVGTSELMMVPGGTIVGTTTDPFVATFKGNKHVRINADTKSVALDDGLITADFPRPDVTDTPAGPARFSSIAQSIPFSEAASGSARPFVCRADGAGMPVWMHGSDAYGPGLVAITPQLTVTLASKAGGDHELSALAFERVGNTKVVLETCGILNTWNEVERWTANEPVPLALGYATARGAWSGPVIAPGASVDMERIRPAKGDLPIHGGIDAHRFALNRPQATLRCATNTSETAPAPAKIAAGLCKRTTRPWVAFVDVTYWYPRIGEGFDSKQPVQPEQQLLAFRSTNGKKAGGLPATPPEHWQRMGAGGAVALAASH